MNKRLIPLLLGICVLGSAQAASTSGTVNTQITIQEDCSISATDMNFGNLGLLRTSKDATSTLTIKCSPNLAYTVKLYDATDASATTYALKNGNNDAIPFGMYTDSTRSTLWNSASGKSGVGDGLNQTMTVYGRIPPQSAKPVGSYASAVRVEVDF